MPVEGGQMASTVAMSDSILTSIKKQLNIADSFTAFDSDIILLINSALSALHQIGVGPDEGFSIEDNTATWSEFIDDARLNMVFQEVYLRVRITFDPPTGTVLGSMENTLKELDWRLSVAAEEVNADE